VYLRVGLVGQQHRHGSGHAGCVDELSPTLTARGRRERAAAVGVLATADAATGSDVEKKGDFKVSILNRL